MTVVEVAAGVHRVPIAPADLVNIFVVVADDGQVTLVDTGLPRSGGKVFAALDALGVAAEAVTSIVLTHAHVDHAGAAAEMRRRTGATVAVHERDTVYVRDGRGPRRDGATLLGRLLNRRPHRWAPTPVDTEFADGDVLPVAGGLRVVHTPGHSPGHVSLLHQPTGTLLVGDALVNVRGLRHSPRAFCTGARVARASAHRLGELDFEVAGFMHGAHIRYGARDAVRALLTEQAA